MPTLILDTDFLIKATNGPFPQLKSFLTRSGFKLATLACVERELKGLSLSKKVTTARKAELALRSLGSFVVVEKTQESKSYAAEADTLLVKFASENDGEAVIATLDGKLLSKLERMKLPYLTLRNDRPFLRTFPRATYLTPREY